MQEILSVKQITTAKAKNANLNPKWRRSKKPYDALHEPLQEHG